MTKNYAFKRWHLALAAIVLIALAVTAQRLWFSAPAAPQVATTPAAIGDLEDSVLATGTIEAARLVSVGAQTTGELKRLHVALGDSVKKGQLIAEIDSLTQQNALRNAHAALLNMQAQKQSKEASLRQAELAAARQRALVEQDIGSKADLETAEATLATTRADIAALEAQIEQARVAEDTAKLNLGYTRIAAPMDGVVVAVVTEEGQTVNAAQSAPTIIKLAKLDTMQIKAQISEADVPRVKSGMPAYFTLLGEPDRRYDAKLTAIEPGPTTIATDTTTSSSSSSSSSTTAIYYNGLFDVPNPQGKLRISMTAQTTIVLAQVKGALLIPSAAVGARDAQGLATVRVLDGEQVVARKVRIGLDNRVQAQVLEGLQAGELVVTSEASPTGSASAQRRGPPPMF